VVEVRYYQVVIDCADPRSLATWWREMLGWEPSATDDDWSSIRAPGGAPRIGFQKVPEPKTVKNRVHLDLAATDEESTAREIEAMGATRRWVSEDPADPFVVLADPEGNEFCIVRAPSPT
jgi:predicted enzyme related to lactoylglutathione lyase